MTDRYRIAILGAYDDDGPVDGDYSPGDYGLDTTEMHPTRDAAEAAARASYLGPDVYGVGIAWCVVDIFVDDDVETKGGE